MKRKILSITMGIVFALSPAVTSISTTAPVVCAATQCGEWSASKIYNTGDVVSYQGKYWEVQWYTQNDIPGTTGEWGVWQPYTGVVTPATPAPTPVASSSTQTGQASAWDAQVVYNTGDIVTHNGKTWKAGWYTINEEPGTTGQQGVWQEVTSGTTTPSAAPSQAVPTPSQAAPTQSVPSPTPSQSTGSTSIDPQSYMNKMQTVTSCPSGATDRNASTAYGSAVKKSYYSTTTQSTRACNVILPANYSPSKKYPVVYYLHGIFGNEDSMLGAGNGTIEIPANLAKAGKAKEMIIVCPNIYAPAPGTAVTLGLNQAYFDGYDNFINDLTNDLMPFIRQTYSVATGRENTAVCGFSMGGRTALYIGYSKPELFGYVGAFSPAPGVTPGTDYSGYHKGLFTESNFKIQNPAYRPYVTLICCGTNDSVVGTFPKSYHDILTRNAQPHVWVEVPGADHDARAISTGFYNFVSSAFGVLN